MDPALPDTIFALPDEGTGSAVLVALSGGLDSSVLLQRLAELPAIRKRGLRALHVHHGLHADADAWAAHCAGLCSRLGVALEVRRVEVARDSGLGLEATARAARHAAFAQALGAGEVLALAHHLDDQAETFLLRALRASGPDGLAAMRPWRRFAGGWMWRPLLAQPRARLEAWARARGLDWIEDPANADPAHARSLLRQQVLPLLRQRWPEASAALARSAALCAEAADLLADDDSAALDALADPPTASATGPLPIAALSALSPPRRARLLRAWAARSDLPPLPGSGITAIEALFQARGDGAAEYRWAGASVRAWRGHLHAVPDAAPLPAGWSRLWDGRDPLQLPGGGRLVLEGADAFDAPLRAHARQGGERMLMPGRRHSHSLKQLLQDSGCPPWVRPRMPLLSDGDGRLLAAGDAVVSAALDAWLHRHGARLRWHDMA